MTGYVHRLYAESLAEFGAPHLLPKSGGWILKRQIPGFRYQDGMGCYPLFCCQDWAQLRTDLEDFGTELVTLTLVTDPFGGYDLTHLHRCFDVVIPFKSHFTTDLSCALDTFVTNHHLRYTRKALQDVSIERCQNPPVFLNEWLELYATLITRHNIKGIQTFSKLSFLKQLNVPGIVMFRAVYKKKTVGMTLWYTQKDVGYYHLGAYSDLGYKLRASFALFWYAIGYFAATGLQWLNLGAGAGIESNDLDGLSRFKRGWSTETRTVYLCGRIFDHKKYSEMVKAKSISVTDYFPAYRVGEFI